MLLNPTVRMLAWRYVKAQRGGFISLSAWFAVIGITLGVATLILVTSLMNGIRDEMRNQFLGIDGHVTITTPYGRVTDYEATAKALAAQPDILLASPKIEGQVMATGNNRAFGAQVVAWPAASLKKRDLIQSHIASGSMEDLIAEKGVFLGSRLAENMGLRLGDVVTLISPQGRATIAGTVPRIQKFQVAGTFTLGMHAFDSSLIVMPFTKAQIYFNLNYPEHPAVSNIELLLHDSAKANQVASRIQQNLGSKVRVYDWQQSNATVFSALTVQRNVMVIILALIVLVAAFNIISSLVMLVKEKQRDIAILRTMGATRSMVMHIFISSGMLLGAVGTFSGVLLGLLLAANIETVRAAIEAFTGQELLPENIYFLSTLPTKTDPTEVAVIMLISLGISLLATIYPAKHAASIHPSEGVRHD
jgi:lipoprotein-releasing system permease protein